MAIFILTCNVRKTRSVLLRELIYLFFEAAKLFFDVVVIVLNHCVNHDGVDEGHSEDAATEEEDDKVDSNCCLAEGSHSYHH